jgi:hypothetical protein
MISVFEWVKTGHASCSATTVIGHVRIYFLAIKKLHFAIVGIHILDKMTDGTQPFYLIIPLPSEYLLHIRKTLN